MKRDWDLIRLLLLQLEGDEVDLSGYSEEQLSYHKYLIVDAGLADGDLATPLGSRNPIGVLYWLNSAGHDFLENARSESIWKRAMARLAKTGGSAGLEVVVAVLKAAAKQQPGL